MTMLKRQGEIKNPVLTNSAANTAEEKFQPAYYDMESGVVYPSCYADGRPAPIHMLDALPVDVAKRVAINIIDGFVRKNRFYTREQAQRAATAA